MEAFLSGVYLALTVASPVDSATTAPARSQPVRAKRLSSASRRAARESAAVEMPGLFMLFRGLVLLDALVGGVGHKDVSDFIGEGVDGFVVGKLVAEAIDAFGG